MRIYTFNDFITEGTLGSENIRNKYYPNMDKSIFYMLVNTDPTSIRKKDFSKPGKYTKWLIREYRDNKKYFEDKEFTDALNYKLFIFSTNWFKTKSNNSSYYISGEIGRGIENDINKYKLLDFYNVMDELISEYKTQTEESKYDLVYEDELVSILVPLNFTASFETAKNTEWCSKQFSGYSMWNKTSIMYRVLPKDNKNEKMKITWSFRGSAYISGEKYPEIEVKFGEDPFNSYDNRIEEYIKNSKYTDRYIKMDKTYKLLSNRAKESIRKHYKKYLKNI